MMQDARLGFFLSAQCTLLRDELLDVEDVSCSGGEGEGHLCDASCVLQPFLLSGGDLTLQKSIDELWCEMNR